MIKSLWFIESFVLKRTFNDQILKVRFTCLSYVQYWIFRYYILSSSFKVALQTVYGNSMMLQPCQCSLSGPSKLEGTFQTFWPVYHQLAPQPPWVAEWFISSARSTDLLSAPSPVFPTRSAALLSSFYLICNCTACPLLSAVCHIQKLLMWLVACMLQFDHHCS